MTISIQRFLKESPPPSPQVPCSTCSKPSKCCDFQPFIPNFTLGALLEKGVDLKLQGSEHFFEPIGLIPAQAFRERREHGGSVQCQFFDKGQCRIWAWRPGECSTYFCEGSTREHELWSEKLFKIETRLAQAALLELGFDLKFAHSQIEALNEGRANHVLEWPKLRELYLASWRWASQVDPEAVKECL